MIFSDGGVVVEPVTFLTTLPETVPDADLFWLLLYSLLSARGITGLVATIFGSSCFSHRAQPKARLGHGPVLFRQLQLRRFTSERDA